MVVSNVKYDISHMYRFTEIHRTKELYFMMTGDERENIVLVVFKAGVPFIKSGL